MMEPENVFLLCVGVGLGCAFLFFWIGCVVGSTGKPDIPHILEYIGDIEECCKRITDKIKGSGG